MRLSNSKGSSSVDGNSNGAMTTATAAVAAMVKAVKTKIN
jgi:hypothetical protein